MQANRHLAVFLYLKNNEETIMASLSNAEERRLLDYSGSSVYLALYTSDPTDADTGTEASWAGSTPYARQSVSFSAAATDGSGNTTATQSGTVQFPAYITGGSPVTITHWGILDAATGGNLRWHGQIKDSGGNTKTETLSADNIVTFASGNIVLSMS